MSTHESVDGRGVRPAYCERCGDPLVGARVCPGCGHERAADTGRDPAPAPDSDADVRGERRRKRRVLGIVAATGAVVVVAGAAATFMLTSSPESDVDLAYGRQVASVFVPVLGADREVSLEMSRLRGTVPTDARAAVRRARQATTIATGALGALVVPAGSEQQARSTRQVLDREDAYLSAASAVLAEPSNPSRSQLQTLSSNLTSAMSAAGGTIAGSTQNVSGADRLTAWAPRAARTLKRRAAARAAAQQRAGARAASGRHAPTGSVNGPAAAPATSSSPSREFQTGFDAGQAYPAAVCRFPSADAGAGVYCWTPNDGYTLRLDAGGAYRVRSDEAANRGAVPGGSAAASRRPPTDTAARAVQAASRVAARKVTDGSCPATEDSLACSDAGFRPQVCGLFADRISASAARPVNRGLDQRHPLRTRRIAGRMTTCAELALKRWTGDEVGRKPVTLHRRKPFVA